MDKLSMDDRLFIIRKRAEGNGYKKLKRLLFEERGIVVGKTAIRALIKKFEITGSVANQRLREKPKTLGSPEHIAFMDELVERQPDITAKELANAVHAQLGLRVSLSRINELRRERWTYGKTKYGQMVREPNQVKRVEWCQLMLNTQETFDVS